MAVALLVMAIVFVPMIEDVTSALATGSSLTDNPGGRALLRMGPALFFLSVGVFTPGVILFIAFKRAG